jgi:hypothetical protein
MRDFDDYLADMADEHMEEEPEPDTSDDEADEQIEAEERFQDRENARW